MFGRSVLVALAATLVVGCQSDSKTPAHQAHAGSSGSVDAPDAGAIAADSGDDAPDAADSSTPTERAGAGGTSAAGAGGNSTHEDPTTAGSGGTAGSTAPVVITNATVTEIATTELAAPSDLAFNPYVADELWVVNHADSSATIISHASTAARSVLRRMDPEGASHFMPSPTGLAFGGRETTIIDAQGKPVEGTFATCPEKDEGFMGPTLWTSDLRIFGIAKSDREPPFNGDDTGAEGPGSHIDMLHRTPTCTGIAWEGAGNVYWTYSGSRAMFVRYDFAKDHGIGNDDHTDGSEWRYPVTGIGYVANTPSHLAWDATSKRVLMVDTGNARVIAFDPASAMKSTPMSAANNLDSLKVAFDVTGGAVTTLIPSSFGLKKPSGLEIHDRSLYVSDTDTSTIYRFTLAGTMTGKVTLSGIKQGALAGLSFGEDGKLYFVDMVDSRVLRLEDTF